VQDSHNPFRLNVGFLINQTVGFSRDFPVSVPKFHLEPDLDLDDISGFARVTRTSQGILAQVKLTATIPAACVRCLSEFTLTLETDFTELYSFAHKKISRTELTLAEDASLNLEPLVREYMVLDIPISPLCKPDCKGLCQICGENLNRSECTHPIEIIDPRLEILKSLLDTEK